MALIHCPECGKEISDKSDHCIHCGVPIFVCKECGEVTAGAVERCPRCGYAGTGKQGKPQEAEIQEAEIEKGAEKETSADLQSDPVEIWIKNNQTEVTRSKTIRRIKKILEIVSPVLWVIGFFVVLFPWINISDKNEFEVLEMILDYKRYCNWTWIFIALLIAIAVISSILDYYNERWVNRCVDWLRRKKIDVAALFEHESEELFTFGIREYAKDYSVAKSSVRVIYFLSLSEKKNYSAHTIITLISNILSFVCVVIFLCNVANLAVLMIDRAVLGQSLWPGFLTIVKELLSPVFLVAAGMWLLVILYGAIFPDRWVEKFLKMRMAATAKQ